MAMGGHINIVLEPADGKRIVFSQSPAANRLIPDPMQRHQSLGCGHGRSASSHVGRAGRIAFQPRCRTLNCFPRQSAGKCYFEPRHYCTGCHDGWSQADYRNREHAAERDLCLNMRTSSPALRCNPRFGHGRRHVPGRIGRGGRSVLHHQSGRNGNRNSNLDVALPALARQG